MYDKLKRISNLYLDDVVSYKLRNYCINIDHKNKCVSFKNIAQGKIIELSYENIKEIFNEISEFEAIDCISYSEEENEIY